MGDGRAWAQEGETIVVQTLDYNRLQMNPPVCHHEPASAGVVIQLDGHGATRLTMTIKGSWTDIT